MTRMLRFKKVPKKILAGKELRFYKGPRKNCRNKSLGGNIVLRQKDVCAFEWCLVLSQKYTKSFGGKIIALL